MRIYVKDNADLCQGTMLNHGVCGQCASTPHNWAPLILRTAWLRLKIISVNDLLTHLLNEHNARRPEHISQPCSVVFVSGDTWFLPALRNKRISLLPEPDIHWNLYDECSTWMTSSLLPEKQWRLWCRSRDLEKTKSCWQTWLKQGTKAANTLQIQGERKGPTILLHTEETIYSMLFFTTDRYPPRRRPAA